MKSLTSLGVLALMLCAAAAMAQSGIPDLSYSETWLAYTGAETPTLLVFPDGQGSSFTQAQLPDGTLVDATVFLRVQDWNEVPVQGFPYEDLWLESRGGGLVYCLGGTAADQDTDADGLTFWIDPLKAGGSSQAPLDVLLNGQALSTGGLPLSFNSPDLNGDLRANLTDVGLFAADLAAGYSFRSDLHRDGVLNLADLGRLAAGMGAQCP